MANKLNEHVVWITGGGTGLGRAMALELAARGAHVAVSGRRVEPLNEVAEAVRAAGCRALAVVCDVTDDDAVRETADRVVEEFGRLDIAIANAGFGVGGKIADTPASAWRRQFDVNVIGLTSTIRWALPHLNESRGRMVLIGSVAGFLAAPGVGAYNASKYAVRAIGQTLSIELAGSGVTCTTIHPGFVESEIAQVDNDGVYHPEWEDRRPAALMWPADRAAKTMVNAIVARKREFVFTGHGKIGALAGRHTPGLLHFAMTKFGK